MTNVHWTVATNYRLRTGSFALMFASIACTLNITISRGLKGMLQSQLTFVTRNRLAGHTVVLAGQYCLHGFRRSCGLWPKRAIAQETMEELTRCADLALYRAKQEGRNRVVMFAA